MWAKHFNKSLLLPIFYFFVVKIWALKIYLTKILYYTVQYLKGEGNGHFQHVFLVSMVGLGGAEIKYHVQRIFKMR